MKRIHAILFCGLLLIVLVATALAQPPIPDVIPLTNYFAVVAMDSNDKASPLCEEIYTNGPCTLTFSNSPSPLVTHYILYAGRVSRHYNRAYDLGLNNVVRWPIIKPPVPVVFTVSAPPVLIQQQSNDGSWFTVGTNCATFTNTDTMGLFRAQWDNRMILTNQP